jgi:multiple sugar transport system permease protein
MIILAGLQSIPESLYEAARMDGANTTTAFRRITLPVLMPFINIGLLFAAVISGALVDIIAVLTEGGPGISTQNMPFLLYKLYFIFWNFDTAGALSVFLLIYAILLLIPLVRGLLKHLAGGAE